MGKFKLSAADLDATCSHIEKTIRIYRPDYEHNDGIELAISDLLADLMHYCDADAIDFNVCLARAQDHFREENGG